MKVSKREKHLLWIILNFDIHRYILANSFERNDGAEKADRHIKISKMICHYIMSDGGLYTIRNIEDEYPVGWQDIHDYLADILTDRLDETIGMVLSRRMTHDEQDDCVRKFFDVIIDHMSDMEKIIKEIKSE